jgi:hypothetical protein
MEEYDFKVCVYHVFLKFEDVYAEAHTPPASIICHVKKILEINEVIFAMETFDYE